MEKDTYNPRDDKQYRLYSKVILLTIVVLSIPLSVMVSRWQHSSLNYVQGIQGRAEPILSPLVTPSPTMDGPTFAPPQGEITPTLYCEPTICSYQPAIKFIPR